MIAALPDVFERNAIYYTCLFDVIAEMVEGAGAQACPLRTLDTAVHLFMTSVVEIEHSAAPVSEIATADRLVAALESVLPHYADRLSGSPEDVEAAINGILNLAHMYGRPLDFAVVCRGFGRLNDWCDWTVILNDLLDIAYRHSVLRARTPQRLRFNAIIDAQQVTADGRPLH